MFNNAKLMPKLEKKSKRRCELCSVVSVYVSSCAIATVYDFDSVCMLDHSLTITNVCYLLQMFFSDIEITLYRQVVV